MKKVLVLLLAFTMILSLVACSSQEEAPAPASPNNNDAPGSSAPVESKPDAPASNEESVVVKIGLEGNESSNDYKVAVKIKELIDANPNANIEIQIFGDGQLGSLRDLVEGLSLNTVGMTLVGANGFENINPNMGVFNPWMVDSPEEAIALYESEVGAQLREQLLAQNSIRMLSYCNCISGTTNLWGNKPMTTLEDYDGVDIRSNNSASNIAALGAFGANPVVLGFADVYNAIETGLIDMTWGSVAVVISGGQGEVLDYIMPAPANFTAGMCAVSDMLWTSMSENQQNVLMEAVIEACQVYGNQLMEETNAAADAMLAEAGVERVEMEPTDYQEMCDLVSAAITEHLSSICDADILEAATAVVAD